MPSPSEQTPWHLVTARNIHNGGPPQTEPTLADRLDLGRVGITPDPNLLSTTTAKDIATGHQKIQSEL